jgi:hypothetical protein
MKELEAVGRAFKGKPAVVTMLEGGGVTPWTLEELPFLSQMRVEF